MADEAISPPSEGEVKMEIDLADSRPALTPPTSENTDKKDDDSGSELSDLEPEEPLEEHFVHTTSKDEEEIVPDHYYEGGKVPVFKPVSIMPALGRSPLWHMTALRCSYHHTDIRPDDEPIPQLQRIYSEDR